MDDLHEMQHQTYMAILQLNTKVDQLDELSRALQLKTDHSGVFVQAIMTNSETYETDAAKSASFAQLARFKAQQIQVDRSGRVAALETSDIKLHLDAATGTMRSLATYLGASVWVEWREYEKEVNPFSEWNSLSEIAWRSSLLCC